MNSLSKSDNNTSFSPVILTEYENQSGLLAYVTIELNKQRLSIKELSSDRVINTLFINEANTKINTIKFKHINNSDTSLILLGLSTGEIWIYAYKNNEIVTKLSTQSNFPIVDLQVDSTSNKLYCCDSGNILHIYDLTNFNKINKLDLNEDIFSSSSSNDATIGKICCINSANDKNEKVLLCSQSVLLYNLTSNEVELKFPGHITPITFVEYIESHKCFVTAAKNDRFLNVYDIKTGNIITVLSSSEPVEASKVTISIDHNSDKVNVYVITESGNLEIFQDIFVKREDSDNIESLLKSKKKKKDRTGVKNGGNKKSKKIDGKITFEMNSKHLPLLNCTTSNSIDELIITWLERVSSPFSKQITVAAAPQDVVNSTSNLFYTIKIKPHFSNQGQKHYQGTDIASHEKYVEGNATVSNGDNFQDLLESEIDKVLENNNNVITSLQDQLFDQMLENTKDHKNKKASTTIGSDNNVDIATTISTTNTNNKLRKKKNKDVVGTLTVILTQALKSNDQSLLDQVLNTRDPRVIKATIYKLPQQQLSILLLQKLAERIAVAKNNDGSGNSSNNSLDQWCKWCLIIHGGYLNTIPDLLSSLSSLHSAMKRKASVLNRLNELGEALDCVLKRNEFNDETSNNEYESEEEEEFVEYVEELDDAGLLIENGKLVNDDSNENEYSEDDTRDSVVI
ncbi:uncharacterized protein SCODWIG_01401 [Saccharomycodes ludwigii]|uniref:Small-subunit processome Utp12 domain-containing protein n=1 Tax=Saccharomycodes ludwigii TaxID=36035 RepID=A0A376B6B4_9ASCO|nr:hypothetical protein SCDLUD_003269 [Saccharomycodes ludwigii]KAH3900297.1 hypothetical protein SCDLUD_003269 [Saccharomycodes ludwigii]SSD59640.1 uncharacterized protein SCODWIG_01401 [Saccharomycodes ludwigii]